MSPRNAAPRGLVNRIVAVPCHAALLVQGFPTRGVVESRLGHPPAEAAPSFRGLGAAGCGAASAPGLAKGVFPPWMASGEDSQLSQPKNARTYSVGKECLQPTGRAHQGGCGRRFGWVAVARQC
jgi:hypothetical protein